MDDIPDDDGYDSGRGDCPGIDPFRDDSDEEMDTEADDDDEDVAEEEEDPSRDDDDDPEEEDPSEEEDDDMHAEEAPAEAEPVDAPGEPVPVEAPAEPVPVEAPAEPAPVEAPAGGEVAWIDIEMDPRSIPISPIALWGPAAPDSPVPQMISDDEWEWETPPVTPPEPFIYEEDSEPDVPSPPPLPTSPPPLTPPPPPPVPMITVFEHDIIVAQHTAEMAVAHARIEDLRMQLDAEVQERLQAQRRQRWSDFRVQRALGSVRRIERRALDRLHSVRRHRSRRHFRRAAARVISRSMRRIRRTIRGD